MSSQEYHTGVIHGRFQVLHNDHVKYLLAGKALCQHLVVGITNPDPFLTKAEDADPERNNPSGNPLTYYERYVLVNAVLGAEGLKPHQFSVVPFPINFPERYKYYVPMDAVFFLTIYDEWGRKKYDMFASMGLNTEVLWERPLQQKGLSSTEIRQKMTSGHEWKSLVPPAVYQLLNNMNLVDRLISRKNKLDSQDDHV